MSPKDESFPNLNTKAPDGLRPGGKPYRVIVVEDKEFQRKQLAQILESEKYEVVAAVGNGKEALNVIDRLDRPVDLLTTNLDMPVLDGYALVFELKQREKRPVVVFISEETTKGVMQDLISMGIGDYILKPINRRVVLERIKKTLVRLKIV
jgi:PleD family two-component response regulator